MYGAVYDLKSFYASSPGRLVRRLLLTRIRRIWPDLHGLRVMGYGYAMPYLRGLSEGTERSFAIVSDGASLHSWPEGEKGLVCLSAEGELPLETESVDRILLIHGVEKAQDLDVLLQEIWRVLKSNGRVLMVVPNRLGLWARADWTPFGHGTPYTAGQIHHYLHDHLFTHERTERALFMPPFRSFLMMRAAYALERVGQFILPGLAGVHLIEAGKQIYAGAGRARTARVPGRRILVGAGAVSTTGFSEG